jgi:hypothetical protein
VVIDASIAEGIDPHQRLSTVLHSAAAEAGLS